jgi:hypothetical protein
MKENDELPVGIENLLALAALDARLRDALCERPFEVAAAAGIALTATESAVLGSLAPDEIRRMAARAPLPEPPHRPLFQQVLDAALVALGLAVLGCTNPSNRATDEADPTPESITSPVRGDEAGAMLPPETDDGPPLPDLRGTRKRDPLYGLRGPRVMPDPHLGHSRDIPSISAPEPAANPGALQNVDFRIGNKVIHNDKDLDGYINPPREDFPHLPGARKRDPLHGLMGPRVMPDPYPVKRRPPTAAETRAYMDRARNIPSIFGRDPVDTRPEFDGRDLREKYMDKELQRMFEARYKPRGKSK